MIHCIFHWSSPKPTFHLAAFPCSYLLPMTGTNCKNHWSWRLISPSLTLSISCQSSLLCLYTANLQIAHPTTSTPYCYLSSCSFAPQYLYLHIIICTSITPVFMLNCNYFTSMAYLLLSQLLEWTDQGAAWLEFHIFIYSETSNKTINNQQNVTYVVLHAHTQNNVPQMQVGIGTP